MKILSIVIPAYNEAATVVELLDRVYAVPLSIGKEMIIVNDGSTDGTAALVEEWVARHPAVDGFTARLISKENGGKGSAVRCGIAASTGDVVIIQDADLEYDPNDYEACIRPILDGRAKVVYGSRERFSMNRSHSAWRFYLGGLAVTYWMNLLYGSSMTDEPTCYKTFSGDLIRAIPFHNDKFGWEPEVTAKLLRLGYAIHEVPIRYMPRKIEAGKKINWRDGVSALVLAAVWRFRPLGAVMRSVGTVPTEASAMSWRRQYTRVIMVLVAVLFLVRLACALKGFISPDISFSRPDTATYVQPALALLEDGRYAQGPGSAIPATLRPPGLPALLAGFFAVFGSGSLVPSSILLCLISALTAIPIFRGTQMVVQGCRSRLADNGVAIGSLHETGLTASVLAALLFGLNITAIAHAPMILSDTFYTFIVAWQLFFFLRFWVSERLADLWLSFALLGMSALIRPTGLPWILPGLFLVAIYPRKTIGRRLLGALGAIAAFAVFTMPWMARNAHVGAGWRIDTNGGNSLYYHNCAALMSVVDGTPAEELRQQWMAQSEADFMARPVEFRTEDSRERYKFAKAKAIIAAHPWTYARLQVQPLLLLPDAPTFLENLGLSQSGRGTLDVLRRNGLYAAVMHYFDGKLWLPLMLLPLLLVAGLTYAGFAMEMVVQGARRNWYLLFIIAGFVAYFLFIPGPIVMPRYHLPALPLMCMLAGIGLTRARRFRGGRGGRRD